MLPCLSRGLKLNTAARFHYGLTRLTVACSHDKDNESTDNSTKYTPDKSFIRNVLEEKVDEKPFYYHGAVKNIDYNAVYTKNTIISASRALSDYLLTVEDLETLRKTSVRTAYSDDDMGPDECYLKSDVEKRAIDRWGSYAALERERNRRRALLEEGERYRKVKLKIVISLRRLLRILDYTESRIEKELQNIHNKASRLSALIGHLKKSVKDQTKLQDENRLFGTIAQREGMMKGSAKVVLLATASNLSVMTMKFVAYLYTGSASMLSEAIHSMADAANQVLLGVGIWQSIRQPSPDHPYGWSRSRYIYSLISACGIFFLGCGFSVYNGIFQLIQPTELEYLGTAYAVLGFSFLTEGWTMTIALRQVAKSAKENGVSFREYVSRGRDPNAVAVLLEDSAALAGIVIAAASLGLTSYTGSVMFDAIGSISIGGLLGFVALFLIRRNADSLIGRSIHPDRLRQIINVLENDIMVRSIHDVKATDLGADSVRFKAEINFDGREVTRVHLNGMDLDLLLKEMKKINTTAELELFMLEHGEQIIDALGTQVDRIERNIKKNSPEVRHVDLEIL